MKKLTRFMRGANQTKPPSNKRGYIWDPEIVLEYLENLPMNDELTLAQLTHKLTMLLALATAQRTQTLKALNLDFVTSSPSTVCFNSPDRMKQTAGNRDAPTLYIPLLPERPKICVKTCFEHYKERTKDIRESQQLLVATTNPHKAVTTTTIAGWLRLILAEAGLDEKVFTAHSTRSAASSKAAKFIPIPKVLDAVDWRSESVFRIHYQRPLSTFNDFAKAILTKR